MASVKSETNLWMDKLQNAKKTCLVSDGKKKVHYFFSDGEEMVEEYDIKTSNLLTRKLKQKSALGGVGKWEYEIGLPLVSPVNVGDVMMESTSNPIFSRVDTPTHFQWRIRNLPYPKSNFSVKLNYDEQVLIVKTENKKYYKKIVIPDLVRCKFPLDDKALSFDHANNTLIISYQKPKEILEIEKKILDQVSKMKAIDEGQVDCAQS